MDSSSDDICTRCGKQQSAVTNLTQEIFLVNTAPKCGHKFCMECIDRELFNKHKFSCPKCRTDVFREKLKQKSLEEAEVERDFGIRLRINAVYNKQPEEFISLDAYKDYEELVESIIYNLTNFIDVEQTNKAVEKYKLENAKTISLNQMKTSEKLKHEYHRIQSDKEIQDANDAAFKEKFKADLSMKKVKQEEANLIMLGEHPVPHQERKAAVSNGGDLNATTSTAPASEQAISHSFVLTYLSRRPEPQIVSTTSKRTVADKTQVRLMHMAGGYDHSCFDRRNWGEVKDQVQSII